MGRILSIPNTIRVTSVTKEQSPLGKHGSVVGCLQEEASFPLPLFYEQSSEASGLAVARLRLMRAIMEASGMKPPRA